MAEPDRIPTMKDVAEEAGVSLGTVSKVINGIYVRESYRLRVEAAVQKLHYQVNSYAQGLKTNRTGTVAVVVPNLVNPFFCALVNALQAALAQKGLRTLLYLTNYDPEVEQSSVDQAQRQKVDGIICLVGTPRLRISGTVPVVSVDRYFGNQMPCVTSDNYSGGRLAVEKLLENGCTRLAFLRVGTRLTNEPNKRKMGFVSACETKGVPYLLEMLEEGSPYSAFEDFFKAHFKDKKLDFDGIFCVSDALAHKVLGSLRRMGLWVPSAVRIVGYDGIRLFGDQEFSCSTIVQPVDQMAEACVDQILQEGRQSSLICLPVSYARGGTTIR